VRCIKWRQNGEMAGNSRYDAHRAEIWYTRGPCAEHNKLVIFFIYLQKKVISGLVSSLTGSVCLERRSLGAPQFSLQRPQIKSVIPFWVVILDTGGSLCCSC
jgi:hypothetical protein